MGLRDVLRTHLRGIDGEVASGERGASFVEYALLIALIVMVCFSAMTAIGQDTSELYTDTAGKVAAASPN